MIAPRNLPPTRNVAALAAGLAIALAACGSAGISPGASSGSLPASGHASMPLAPTPAASSGTPAATDTFSPTASPPNLPPPTIGLNPVVGGLSSPIGLSSAPGDPRLFVINQDGRVTIVSGGSVTGTFLNMSGRISCCGERGLLGLAFHPQYASNGRFFVRYTNPAGDLRVSEFHAGANPNAADPASEKILLTIPHPSYGNHNGGRIAFGPDGHLYIGTGDGGSGGDPNNHGQSLNTLLGKMLRIDVDGSSGTTPYAIPVANPFVGQSGARPEIWSYGLRNPYSFSFDRRTGDLWIADVGQDSWEEIDRATVDVGGGRGANFGWRVMEGNHCYNPNSGCRTSGLTPPYAEYAHGSGDSIGCAVIGGYVYRGSRLPQLYGRYLFGDECSGRIWDVPAAGSAPQTPRQLVKSSLTITGWGEDSSGELYVTAMNGGLYVVS